MGFLDFLHKYVFLVEEEHNRGGGEVAVVADAVEQVQTFVHPVLREMSSGFFSESDQKWQIVRGVGRVPAGSLPLRHPPPAPCRRRSARR